LARALPLAGALRRLDVDLRAAVLRPEAAVLRFAVVRAAEARRVAALVVALAPFALVDSASTRLAAAVAAFFAVPLTDFAACLTVLAVLRAELLSSLSLRLAALRLRVAAAF